MKFFQPFLQHWRSSRCLWLGSTGILLSTVALALPGLTSPMSLPFRLAGYTCQDCSRPSSPVTSGGIRGGCSRDSPAPFVPLAPESHIGRTMAAYPTFTWYVPDADSYPMEFLLYAVAANGSTRLEHQADLTSTPQVMSYTLPAEHPGLQAGQRYLWQVVLVCDPTVPSAAIIEEAFLDVVAASMTTDSNTPAIAPTDLAAQGFWYDALAHTLTLSDRDAWLTLVADLATLEGEAGSDRHDELLQILRYEAPSRVEE